MVHDALIIGGGLFGKIIARALTDQGLTPVIIEAEAPNAGSGPAACLMKPSWYSGLGKTICDPALAILDRMYGIQEIEFAVGINLVKQKVQWIDPQSILEPKLAAPTVIKGRVSSITQKYSSDPWEVMLASEDWNQQPLLAKIVIVAAGIWTNDILKYTLPQVDFVPGLTGRAGVSFLLPGQLRQNKILPWAPYRQLVAFNISPDTVWVGDGTALKPESLTNAAIEKCLDRCTAFVNDELDDEAVVVQKGIRPYVPECKPCYLEQPRPGLWIATGGAKNGTLAAGWCAHEIARKL